MIRKFNPTSPRRPRPPPSRLETHIGFWLRRVSSQLSHTLSRKFEHKGVTLAEWLALRELYDGDLRPSALAERLGLTRGAISKLAERLVRALMITQEANTPDGRGQMLAITDTGRDLVRELAGILEETDEEFFGHLERDTRSLMMSIMRDVIHRHGSRAVPVDRFTPAED